MRDCTETRWLKTEQNWCLAWKAVMCPISSEHTLLYRGLAGKRGDNALQWACRVRWSLWLSARIFHVLLCFKQTPSDPGFCRGGLYLEQAFLWSRLPSPHTFFRGEQINGRKRASPSVMGDYFHLLPDGGHNKISGFTFSFHPSCFRWSQNLTCPPDRCFQ